MVAAATVLLPLVAEARIEMIRWGHAEPEDVAGFRVYVRDVAGSYGSPVYEGMLAPDAEGVYRVNLDLADNVTVIVAIAAYGPDDLESGKSNERQLDAPPPPPADDPPPDIGEGNSDAGAGDSSAPTSYRLNSGGGSYTDASGAVWEPDAAYARGGVAVTDGGLQLAGPLDSQLYDSWRVEEDAASTMSFELPLPDGIYRVRLHTVEVWAAGAVGQRVFDVTIEGYSALDDYDVVEQVGVRQGDSQEFDVAVTDGSLSIVYAAQVMSPIVSAIEVAALAGGSNNLLGPGSSGGSGDGSDSSDTSDGSTADTGTGGGDDSDDEPPTAGDDDPSDGGDGVAMYGAPGKPQLRD
jgi:hypothetical protein